MYCYKHYCSRVIKIGHHLRRLISYVSTEWWRPLCTKPSRSVCNKETLICIFYSSISSHSKPLYKVGERFTMINDSICFISLTHPLINEKGNALSVRVYLTADLCYQWFQIHINLPYKVNVFFYRIIYMYCEICRQFFNKTNIVVHSHKSKSCR